jgi:hypothetical protein
MTGEDGRQVFAAILPPQAIDRLCAQCGGIERQRKRHLGLLVRAMLISAGTPGGAYQADVLRSSLACEVPKVARSAFSRWVAAPREPFMAALADRALTSARAQQGELSGLLGGVKAWSSVDSTTVNVRDALRAAFPGTGKDAALNGPKGRSVGCGAPVRYHVSPAREHDRRHLEIDASWRGCGLLVDLASASGARRRAGNTPGVRVVIRLTDNWKPKGASIARGQVTPEFFPGTDLDALLEEELRVLDGRAIEADVPVGEAKHPVHRRLVGVPTPTGSGVCRTHLPPRIGPRPVAPLYRVRWEVELRRRVDTSVHRLDEVDAERPCSLKTLLHASRIAALIAALLAHPHHRQTRPPQEGAPRTEAPRPPRRLAWQRAVSCQMSAQAVDLQGIDAMRRWQQIADLLPHSGRDPTWRRRPSVLDQLRGWKRQPVGGKHTNRRNLKAAA